MNGRPHGLPFLFHTHKKESITYRFLCSEDIFHDRHPHTRVSVFIYQYHSALQAITDTSAKIP